jgi:tungstate transport system permease protein
MSITQALIDAFMRLAQGDALLWTTIGISLKTTALALVLIAVPSVLAAYALAYARFPGRNVLRVIVQTSLALPTVLIGLVLYLMLSRAGPLGMLDWLFTQKGLVLGQAALGFPLITAFLMAVFDGADARLLETVRTLGAQRMQRVMTVMHELRGGVAAAFTSGFGRVVSEVGCALMVGGNIDGLTRTMTTAIALETSKGDFAQGIALGIVLLVIALSLNALVAWLQRGDRKLPWSAT